MTPTQKTTVKRYLYAGAAYTAIVALSFGVLGQCSEARAAPPTYDAGSAVTGIKPVPNRHQAFVPVQPVGGDYSEANTEQDKTAGGNAIAWVPAVTTVDASGVAVSNSTANINAATALEDAASTDGFRGVPTLCVRQSAFANSSGTDGDFEPCKINAGQIWVQQRGLNGTSTTTAANPFPTAIYTSEGTAVGSGGVLLVSENGSSFANITTATDTNVKAAPGTFVGIVVNTAGVTSTASVYNDADGTCSSGLIGTFSTVAQTSLTVNAAATVGICVTTTGGTPANITILYR